MVKNIYALTPLQEGMLFHSLNREENTPYFEQMIFEIEGRFNQKIFEQSWNVIVERHDTFRTIFVHKNTQDPKQVVLKEGKVEFFYDDLSFDSKSEDRLNDFIKKDKDRYFNLAKKTPLRVNVFKLTNNLYKVILDFHHILMDGWSGGIVFEELFSIYNDIQHNRKPQLSAVKPYNLYIQWLNEQNKVETKEFWNKYLLGYEKEAIIPKTSQVSGYKLAKSILSIDQEMSKKVNHLVQEHGLTLNTFMQTVWGLLLAQMNKRRDVVFAATVSGRVDEIDGIERMVGLFINAIPIRIKFSSDNTFLELLKKVMDESLEAQKHHYYSLAEIQNATPLKDGLIQQLMVFENYPSSNVHNSDIGFDVKNLDVFNQTNYDFDITIMPHETIDVIFKYNTLVYNEELISSINNIFITTIKEIVDSPNKKIAIETKSKDVFISSTFTAEPIEQSLALWSKKFGLELDISFSGYNQVLQNLIDQDSLLYRDKGLNLLLIRFEDVLRFLHLETLEEQIKEVDKYHDDICALLENNIFKIPTFILIFKPKSNDLDAYLLSLYEKFYLKINNLANVYPLDLKDLKELYQIEKSFDRQQDKVGHIPFTDDYFSALGTYVSRQIYSFYYPHFKVIALDCDNTIWGGVVGEDGALGVKITGGFLALQKFILKKQEEGFLIVLNSKNNANDVWEVFEKNPKMLLKKEHIVNFKINWQTKSQNLKEMAKELNLGLSSFVFLDDNPLEVSEVIQNAPEVLAIPLPKSVESFELFLEHIWAFDKLKVTQEDKNRTKMYIAENYRTQTSKKLSMDDFLASLELKIYMNKMFKSQLSRTAQLTNRTNQFNTSTIRRTNSEIESLLKDKNNLCWTINVEDKFGDYGLIGVVISKIVDKRLVIDTFLMSCRVLGRGVELSILSGLKKYAQSNNLETLEIPFYPTAKNQPALDFIHNNHFKPIQAQKKLADSQCYQLEINALLDEPSFVEFLFDKDESIFDNDLVVERRTEVVVEEEHGYHAQNDFKFDFLESVSETNREKLLHLNFYEPLKFHKAIDTLKLLHKLENRVLTSKFIPAKSESEIKLERIYKELLLLKKVGLNDCFFALGGHSLTATRLLSRVYQSFKVELSMQDIFSNTTIKKLLLIIEKKDKKLLDDIPVAKIMDNYPLSNAQKRVWLVDKMGGGIAYNMPIVLNLKGALDILKFNSVLNKIIQRHEILRTKFILLNEEPRQEIVSTLEISLELIETDIESAKEEIEEDIYKVFNLEEVPLFRVKLYRVSEDNYVFYFNTHHIISDGWSLGVIADEINSFYHHKAVSTLKIQYKDYSIWQNEMLNSTAMKETRRYWQHKLHNNLEPLELPLDFSRSKTQTFNGDTLKIDLSNFLGKLEVFNQKETTTLFMFLTAIIKMVLAKYADKNDVVLGFPISGRDKVSLENQIGFYANTLVLRDEIDFDNDFYTLIKQIKKTLLEAYKHQNYPFEKLVNELSIPRDMARSPLFDYVITFNNEEHHLDLGEIEVSNFDFDFKMAQFDMSFNFATFDNQLTLGLNYNSDLFKSSTIERILKHTKTLIQNVLMRPTKPLKHMTLLESNIEKVSTDLLISDSIIDLFEVQVKEMPTNNAINFYNKNLNYKELDELSNRVANYLKEVGAIQRGEVVSFLLDRSELSVISLLAILKVGATFLPLSTTLPKERIKYIIKDSKSKFNLTKENIGTAMMYENSKRLKIPRDLNSLAYIIYTSGTTGNPKGVTVSEKSLLNLCHWYIKDFSINAQTKALLMIPTSFDASIKNILAPLFVGGTVVISKEQFDAFDIENIIETQNVSLVNCVPSAFKAILDVAKDYESLKSIQHLAFGGESLDIASFRAFYLNSNIQLFNIYGPTEACDISAVYEVQEEDLYRKNMPIGKAIENVQLYVLDRFNMVTPIGVRGELVIAGLGLSEGYMNNSVLTNKSFVNHDTLGRIYKTGDVARQLESADIEYIGRDDDQIKIRGNRIELKEIEYKILEIKALESVVVLVKNKTLSAYIKPSKKVKIKVIREHLQNTLPSYMIPVEFIKIKTVPLTPNGKIDTKFLLNIKGKSKKESKKSLTKIEKHLVKIFNEVLNKQISIRDNFFDIGGDSLSAVKVISRVNNLFGSTLKLSTLFEHQTIEYLAQNIDQSIIENKHYKIFNEEQENAIFIFPSLLDAIDYSIVASKIAKHLSMYKVYALDFITGDNRIKDYVTLIDSLEKNFIVLGYSSGGNLAFEVINQLQKKPKKLILVDSWRIKKFNSVDKKIFDKELMRNIKIKKYLKMLNKTQNTKKDNIEIDLIKAKKNKKSNGNKYLDQKWKFLTKKSFKKHQGFGTHFDMFKDDFITENCNLIKKILEDE